MTHRCEIQRNTAAGTDAEGNPVAPTFTTLVASQPCRFWHGSPDREVIDDDRSVVVEQLRMFMPLNADITEADQIDGVKDRAAVDLHVGVLNIRSVVRRPSHLELELQGASA